MRRFGRYEVGEELGRGAMATVHQGYDPQIRRTLAIKILHDDYACDPEYRQRFLTEARAAGTLTHPGIVTVFDVGEAEGRPFIAMELVEGQTLDAYAEQFRPLLLRNFLKVAQQLAEALDYAHRHGVIHRDIKPENILVTSATVNIKVMDFGIAETLFDPEWRAEDHTASAGTPHYMAPELIRGGDADGRSDLWSMGVVLYELLTGHRPFLDGEAGRVLQRVLEEPVPEPRPIIRDCPEDLVAVVRRLLERDPSRRYQSAAELLVDLQRIEDERAERERAGAGRRIVPLRLRWTAVMGALVAVTLAVGAFLVQQKQNEVMTDLAFDYGSTLAGTIAVESAEDLLLEDSIAMQARLRDMQANREIELLSVSDRHGRIVASSDPEALGEPRNEPPAEDLLLSRDGRTVWSTAGPDGNEVFLFEAPVRFQDFELGHLQVALSTSSLQEAGRTTMMALLMLTVVTVLAVLLGVYVFARRLQVPMETLRGALDQIAQGRLDTRIRVRRRDDFERVFSAYNAMADSLEARVKRAAADPAPSGHKDDASATRTMPVAPPERPPGADPGGDERSG
ncbi:serine/threonine-protein kinase [Thioalkalivibrio sp. ALE11]|uniref:serine/threonine-protein kinase n=1 Tax=Thioalkalivibrio sp. ALE11 TaxID=1265494 RepID=UPI000365DD9E|nr:serine/threonine-protein kinase [Thioalkalivibrio sp. ALE11]